MSTENVVGLTLCIVLSTVMALGLFGVWDRLLTGKWPGPPRGRDLR